jgi:hypothetical protein
VARGTYVQKSWQAAGEDALEALHRGCGRVGRETHQVGSARLR